MRATLPLAALAVAGGVGMACCQWLIYGYAPIEQSMGPVQKIFYFHLPVAWWCFVSFFVACAAGIAYLKHDAPPGICCAPPPWKQAWYAPPWPC